MEQFKKLFQATERTVGTPCKKIVAFTIPMLLEILHNSCITL